MFFSSSPKWNPDGQHIYVTGGSSGLGLAVSIELVKRGANISIVARDKLKLDTALNELETHRQNPGQKLAAYSFGVATAPEAEAALKAACEPYNGQMPDSIFTCAGGSVPGYMVEFSNEQFEAAMNDSYWVQAWTAFIAFKLMAKQKRKGKIVLISSTLGVSNFLGFGNYPPGKHAVRALGDGLNFEGLLYEIETHVYFPGAILSPGYLTEVATKPQIATEIEGTVTPQPPEEHAGILIRGIEKGQAHICGDLVTSIIRASTRGLSSRRNERFFFVGFMDFLAFIGLPIWWSVISRQVVNSRAEHAAYLEERGFYM